MTLGPMEFRGSMGFRGPIDFRGPMEMTLTIEDLHFFEDHIKIRKKLWHFPILFWS